MKKRELNVDQEREETFKKCFVLILEVGLCKRDNQKKNARDSNVAGQKESQEKRA